MLNLQSEVRSHVCQTSTHPPRSEAFHVRPRLMQTARCRVCYVWKPAVVLRYINFTQASAHQSHAHATLLCASECMHAAQSLADHSDSRPQFHKPRSFFADRGSAGRACSLTLLVPATSQRWRSLLSIHPRTRPFLGTSPATRLLAVSHLQRCTQAVTVTTRTPLRFGRCPLSL